MTRFVKLDIISWINITKISFYNTALQYVYVYVFVWHSV